MALAQFGQWRYRAAGGLVMVAVAVFAVGQPTNADKWNAISGIQQPRLDARDVYVHPGEVLDLIADPKVKVILLDVRSETDYNLFHILDAVRVEPTELLDRVSEFHNEPANAAFILMSNDETTATEAWRILMAESVPNLYILEGGINNWLNTFSDETFRTSYGLAQHS
jgi:rhodanese-related sulfurtransferase